MSNVERDEFSRKTFLSVSVIIIILLSTLSGCTTYRSVYDISLKEVERPAKAKERYGVQKIIKVEKSVEEENYFKDEEKKYYSYFGQEKYNFEDEMIKIAWIPTPHEFLFILTNKTDHSIKIVWDEASYVDISGESHRVMHSGVKYIDRDSAQPPSIVVRRGTFSDLVMPTDYIGGPPYYLHIPLFPIYNAMSDYDPNYPKYYKDSREEFIIKTKDYIGKTVQILLPLQIEDVVNEYIFIFELKGVEIQKVEPVKTSPVINKED